jgi:6-pyruvoyltetrahydropterin/6-carboxytetrahydropterin synthase
MYEIAVHAEFCAAHALTISGVREPTHGHNFRVTARIEGLTLDADGLLCDFHTVAATLNEIIEPFNNQNLNEIPPFGPTAATTRSAPVGPLLSPSAELIARYIADELSQRLDAALNPNAQVASVSVTEAPGCVATYRVPPRHTT